MSFEALLSRPVRIHHRARVQDFDGYGNPIDVEETVIVARAHLEQMTTTETEVGQDTTGATWSMFLPAGTLIDALDRIEVPDRGLLFEVEGLPSRPWRPSTGEHHVEVRLQLINDERSAP